MEKFLFENDLISIIMPAYNAEKYIAESIVSVINQTYSFWELLIINDCSQDMTLQAIDKYVETDKRIKLIDLETNFGVAEARNIGINAAKGRYIAFLDSDDFWLPTKLARQIEFMKGKKAEFSYTQYKQFIDSVEECGSLIDVDEKVTYKSLLKGNIIGCLTVMIDRYYIHTIEMPKERHEDYISWLNILKQGFCAYGIKEDLARYRKSSKSLSGNKFKSLLWTWQVYNKTQKLSFGESSYYFIYYVLKGIRKYFS